MTLFTPERIAELRALGAKAGKDKSLLNSIEDYASQENVAYMVEAITEFPAALDRIEEDTRLLTEWRDACDREQAALVESNKKLKTALDEIEKLRKALALINQICILKTYFELEQVKWLGEFTAEALK